MIQTPLTFPVVKPIKSGASAHAFAIGLCLTLAILFSSVIAAFGSAGHLNAQGPVTDTLSADFTKLSLRDPSLSIKRSATSDGHNENNADSTTADQLLILLTAWPRLLFGSKPQQLLPIASATTPRSIQQGTLPCPRAPPSIG